MPDDPKKGKWSKTERLTFTAEIIRDCKRARTPGPSTYKPKKAQDTVRGCSKVVEPQSAMIEEARYRGKQTPAPGPGPKKEIVYVSF